MAWVKQLGIDIPDIEERTIFAARQNFLWYKGKPWKKQNSPSFDVTMGSFDGAEICEFIGLYILHKITSSNLGISKQECGLYRDDGIIITRKSKRELDILRKKLHQLFTPLGLNITVNSGTKQVDFLDVTLDLTTGTFQPYRKETAPPVYVHRKSNHPP